ncbi:apoptosis-inducing factor 1, mitochondrial [Schistocerca serialis cubense]|uniref:apoptosis-inducing factor 1, mitochondrial n=1 Tax=Schistocerca serialis cubense TaxID=2023355 RepID=UPI00214EC81E|nr:apoptosis-inducing factor 1, mitochondrial [Schistocerca serialis cubense]
MLRNIRYVAHIAGIGPWKLQRCPTHDFQKYRLCLTTFRSNSTDPCKQTPKCPPQKPVECRDTKKPVPPKEVCPKDDGSKKKYTRQLIGGLLFAAISLFTLYHFLQQKQQDKGDVVRKGKKRKTKPIVKSPPDSKDIPKCVPYLLIGGGTAAFSAFRSIKSSDPTAKVLIVSNESCYPYMRPPLSKELWFNEDDEASKKLLFKQWNGTERSLFYEPEDFYVDCKCLMEQANGGVAVARGWNVKKVDVTEKIAYLEDGHEIRFKKCLIATGASPKNLPVFEKANDLIQEKVTLFRDVYDFEELHAIVHKGVKNIAVIGGGFLGTELACALARHGCKEGVKVQQIFPESGTLGKILPEYLSQWTMNKVKAEGVNVIPNAEVKEVDADKGQVVLKLSNGQSVQADHIVVAVGVKPNTELAGPSGLEVDEKLGGFLVNAELVARSNVWAAGDCTCFYDVKFGRRRVEHHDHAVVSGRLAGENMTGAGKHYWHQSMFWSDLGPDVGFEAIGIVDAQLPTVGVYAKPCDDSTSEAKISAIDAKNKGGEDKMPVPATVSAPSAPKKGENYEKGVIFYLRDETVVGIVLWNVFNRMSTARQVLKDESKYDDLNEVAKLFNIHED